MNPNLRPDIVYPNTPNRNGPGPALDFVEYQWHFLAEGDSWFTIGGLPTSNLLFEMRFKRWTQIFNLGYPGDTIKRMSDLSTKGDLGKYLAQKRFSIPFTGLLLSGGGNDVIDAASSLLRKTPKGNRPEDFIDEGKLQTLLENIQASYATIINLRDASGSQSQGVPAFTHTYDYSTPRDAPATFFGTVKLLGPWLFKAFKGRNIDPKMQQLIANLMIDRLADALLALDSRSTSPQRLSNFHVVDTRNTLVAANATEVGNSNDWANEIHPNHDGYRKIAGRLSAVVNAHLT